MSKSILKSVRPTHSVEDSWEEYELETKIDKQIFIDPFRKDLHGKAQSSLG